MRIEEVIGDRIRQVRDLQELTQEQLGQRLGELLGKPWSRQAVHVAEQGGRQFTAAELVALASVLNTTVPRLMTPTVEVREVELPSGARVARVPLTKRVMPRGSVGKTLNSMEEQLRLLAVAVKAQQDQQGNIWAAIDLLHQSLEAVGEQADSGEQGDGS
ncbi:Helix-turn-helix domain-containing protein [Amycolatopsis tolypomycina]|uniref:Helix-turn-helix domain-containing protein n=1 Tax=Amycolatopsis tolypomycina TaxID=208445 RepID=A0A1H4WPZ7_9PSEU|nr:helix-turn-helix transcriptional regulator [Amycolatopsis tolypomycina]SEC95110.1 Helix-turn-helix domain-containing protein [Amycolatopsis tolypomycina]